MRGRKGGDYEIGYGKPPRQTRFKQGQSGNVRGRPRGSKNFATSLMKGLNERVTISENGRRRKITMRETITKQALNKAAAGNSSLIRMLFNHLPMLEARFEESRAATRGPTPLSPGIVDLFAGAVRIIEEHGATPPNMERAIPMADAAVPVKKEAAPTILPASAADANSAQAKKPEEEDPPF
jgi:Family of unknown function (DUF5681)